mmetsp:Transcript_375/g.1287  ORF Transcript_375/g.1287 Transcript_375/m.1287 type:complete len:275 (-) Transcript_375:662-1486(-)
MACCPSSPTLVSYKFKALKLGGTKPVLPASASARALAPLFMMELKDKSNSSTPRDLMLNGARASPESVLEALACTQTPSSHCIIVSFDKSSCDSSRNASFCCCIVRASATAPLSPKRFLAKFNRRRRGLRATPADKATMATSSSSLHSRFKPLRQGAAFPSTCAIRLPSFRRLTAKSSSMREGQPRSHNEPVNCRSPTSCMLRPAKPTLRIDKHLPRDTDKASIAAVRKFRCASAKSCKPLPSDRTKAVSTTAGMLPLCDRDSATSQPAASAKD